MELRDTQGTLPESSQKRRDAFRLCCRAIVMAALSVFLLAGCSDGAADKRPRQTLEVVEPAAVDEPLMVEGGCLLADASSDEVVELRPLEYSEPRFHLADRLPDGVTLQDVYYYDLVGSDADSAVRLPCDVGQDTTLPAGFTYLVVDVNVRSHEDEKVEFCLADAMLCAYDCAAGPGLEFWGVPENEYPRAEFDQLVYGGSGAYSVLAGCETPFWASGYEPKGARLPGEPVGNYWRDLWIDPDKRFQLYYIVPEEDARRGDLAWIASARRDVDAPRVYAYRVEVE